MNLARTPLKQKRETPRRKTHPIATPWAMGNGRTKEGVFRDRAWMDAIASQEIRCAVTGRKGREGDWIVPAHVGTAGKGIKSPDNEVIPMLDSLHRRSHSQQVSNGFQTFWCEQFMKDKHLLLDALKAYAREQHSKWKDAA